MMNSLMENLENAIDSNIAAYRVAENEMTCEALEIAEAQFIATHNSITEALVQLRGFGHTEFPVA